MNSITGTATAVALSIMTTSASAAVEVTVSPDRVKTEISPSIYGTGMEDVNHEIYGGLDAQRLFGESFEEPPLGDAHGVSQRWFRSEEMDGGEFMYVTDVVHQGKAAQVLIPDGGVCAIANMGLNGWGVNVRAGGKMRGHVFVRGVVDSLVAGVQDRDGARTYASAELATESTDTWRRVDFQLVPDATDRHARFFLRASGKGKVWLDDVYLADEPTNVFGRLGCREDIVQGFRREGVNFLRWGGTMVNVPGYRLKNMRGDGARTPYEGWWYKWASGGFGPYEFVRMAEAMGLPCAVAINVEEEIPDAVAFAEWLKTIKTPVYVELGNEECVPWFNSYNLESYRAYIANAKRLIGPMRKANPSLRFINGVMWWGDKVEWAEEAFRALDGLVDYWDIHVDNTTTGNAANSCKNVHRIMGLMRKWNPQTKMRIAVLEENGNNHSLERALGHAIFLGAVRELGADCLTSCGANALQPYLQNDNWWYQGQIYFTPDKVWLQPYGYAQQMASAVHRERLVESQSECGDVFVSATRDAEGRSVVLHLVNVVGTRQTLAVSGLEGWRVAKAVSLHADKLKADNPYEAPERVTPQDVTASFAADSTLPAYSYTTVEYLRK